MWIIHRRFWVPLAAMLFHASCPCMAQAQGLGFKVAPEFFTGSDYPFFQAKGDFNSDGNMDLAITHETTTSVSILLGNGDGAFATPVDYPTVSNRGRVVAADFDGDNRPDLALAFENGSVAILYNEGNAVFSHEVDYHTLGSPTNVPFRGVVAADLDNDGAIDLAVAGILIFRNRGDGTFESPIQYAAGGRSIAAADFNADGSLDLASATEGSPSVVLLNQGNCAFSIMPSPWHGIALTGVDVDSDGYPDVAVVSSGATLELFRNLGDATFNYVNSFNAGPEADAIVVADFNGDQRPDLAVADDHATSVLLNIGNGDFKSRAAYEGGQYSESIIAADFDSDGRPDLSLTNEGNRTVSFLRNMGDGSFYSSRTFEPPNRYPGGTDTYALVGGDFNGDGRPDVAIASAGLPLQIVILRNLGGGYLGNGVSYPLTTGPTVMITTDFDGDGKIDLVAGGADRITSLKNLGDSFGTPVWDPLESTCRHASLSIL